MGKYSLLLFLIGLSLIVSKTITTTDYASAIRQASPGDTIELLTGTYSNVPYGIPSGSEGKPITIKAAPNAKVVFVGTTSKYIFEQYQPKYVNIEGPFELKTCNRGVSIYQGYHVTISGLTIHDVQYQGIAVTGHYITVSNNEVYDCSLENKYTAKSREYGWSQCVAVHGISQGVMSTNIAFKNNKIHEGYGEALDFLECDTCSAIGNDITNGFSMNIYVDASRNIVIEGNILRVNTDYYNTKWGRACGIGMAPESGGIVISNILIQNNVMIGTRMGIYFFTMGNGGAYDKIRIYHNTLWNVGTTPVWFRAPNNTPTGCEMKNNFFYVEGTIEFSPKSSWSLGYNYYYNTYYVPSIYSDSSSKSAQTLDVNGMFNNKGNCNYWDQNLDVECLHPSKNPGYFKLYHTGTELNEVVSTDFNGCPRKTKTPSIGAFENYDSNCSEEDTTESETTEDSTQKEEEEEEIIDACDVKVKINYCTSGSQIVKMVGSHCSWNVGSCTSMTNEGNCNWVATLSKGTNQKFSFKFIIGSGSSASRWESDPNRTFNGADLKSVADKAANGKYESCDYSKSGSVITLTCYWR
jgi:hypothetical protein